MGSSPEECLLKTKIVDSVRTVSFMAFQFAPFPTLPPQFCSILENQKPEFSMKTSSLAAPRLGGRGAKQEWSFFRTMFPERLLAKLPFIWQTELTRCSFLRNHSSKQTKEMLNCCLKWQITVETNYRLTKKLKRKLWEMRCP